MASTSCSPKKRQCSARMLRNKSDSLPGGAERPSLSRQLTGKYDMSVLKELMRTEEAALEELARLYKVESEEDLPFRFDIYKIVDMTEANRRTYMTDLLEGCPSRDAVQAFVDKYLHRIKHLNPHLP